MSQVQIRNVRKSYGSVDIIHGVDVEIAEGEFVILVGPSGCGKSTLLRMIAGLETITGGEIAIGGRVVNDLQPKERDIAMVFQNYALYPQMTVAQNMGFALELAGLKKPEIDKKVRAAAAILSLEPLLERKPAQLSGGQRQRVAMGRAIVRDPKVFLFDEPLSNLDAKLGVQMRGEIKALHERLGSTIVYVTHDQIEAMTMADKIVMLHGGHIEQVGAPLELYDRPANTFVASFIGSPSMNFLDGTLRGGDVPMLELDDGVSLPLGTMPRDTAGRRVTFGIRPEDILLDDSGVPATVVVTEPTGSETHVLVDLGGRQLVCLLRTRLALHSGDKVKLSFRTPAAHFFDPESTRRIG